VIDGVCRDISTSLEEDYPIFARANTHRTGKDRVTADSYNVPIQLSGVRVEPGDWLVGDGDGLVCIPATRIEEVLATTEEIAAAEQRIVLAVKAGMRLDEARSKLGYHMLQTAGN
jgi:regulator of RNase E activity RraA